MRREQVFWGWGEAGAGPALPEDAEPFLREQLGVDGGVVARPVALADVRLAPPALDARAARGARRGGRRRACATTARRACCAPPASPIPTCCASARATARPRRTRSWRPRTHDEVRAVLAALLRTPASRSCRSAAGRASSAASSRCAAGIAAVVSLDLGRLDALLAVDERSLTAVLAPGLRLPELERALGERGLTLGHFPQSYEYATVGGCVATRSAGQASTGYGRIDELVARRAAGGAARRRSSRSPCPADGGRAGPARARRRLRGRARRHHARWRCACGRRRRSAATRASFVRVVRRGRRGAARARAGGRGARRRAAVRRGGDAHVARAGGRRRRRRALAARYLRARGRRGRLPADRGLGGRATRRSRAAAARRSGCCARPARCRSAAAPGSAVARPAATTGRTCATTCSTAACSSRRSRRRRRGRTSSGCYRAVGDARARGHAALVVLPRLAPVSDRRVAVLHVPRRARTPATGRAVARGQDRGDRRDRRRRRHDHPPPRGRPRPRAVAGRRGRARSGSSCCARSRSAATPPGS